MVYWQQTLSLFLKLSDLVGRGVLMNILGNKVVVSQNATTDNALQFIPKVACTWKSYGSMSSMVISDPGIGKKNKSLGMG